MLLSTLIILYLCFQTADSYGNEVTLLARPMPIEYVLVQVGAVGYTCRFEHSFVLVNFLTSKAGVVETLSSNALWWTLAYYRHLVI